MSIPIGTKSSYCASPVCSINAQLTPIHCGAIAVPLPAPYPK
jgi:hypothetical protein